MSAGPSRTNIKEANEHLKQLHQKVFELENQVQLQAINNEELQRANAELQQRTQATVREKDKIIKARDSQIAALTHSLQQSEERVQTLLATAQERDAMIVKLERKARLFYEVAEHRSVLGRMVDILEELSKEEEEEDELRLKEKKPSSAGGSPDKIAENGGGASGGSGKNGPLQDSNGSTPPRDTANR